MRNSNTGANAEYRFVVADTAGAYLAFTQPSTGNTNTLFGMTRSAGSFIFSNGGSRAIVMGAVNAQPVVLGTNNLERLRITSAGTVGIGTSSPQAGAILDLNGAGTGGSSFIVPRDSSANRPVSGVNGMIRYNTTTQKLEVYEGSWQNMISGSAAVTAVNGFDFSGATPSTGSVLRWNSSAWERSSATYPDTTTAGQLLYSSAANTVGEVTTANLAVLMTDSAGFPFWRAGVNQRVLKFNGSGAFWGQVDPTNEVSQGSGAITIQSAAGSAATFQGGTGGVNLTSSNTGATAVNITATGAGGGITIAPSSTGAITIGAASDGAAIFGNNSTTAATTIRSGTGGIGVTVTGTSGDVGLTGGTTSGNITLVSGSAGRVSANAGSGGITMVTAANGNITLIPGGTGNVGIGSATPAVKLDVAGSGNFTGAVNAPAFYYTSDIRLKKNFKPVAGLEAILKLNGYEFDWKSDSKHEIGLIAQEVEEVFPDLVNVNPSTGFKAVKYGNLVSPLIESTKELYGMCKASQEQMRSIASVVESNKRETDAKLQDLQRQVDQLVKSNGELHRELQQIKARLRKQ
jgi:hypothetical protein